MTHVPVGRYPDRPLDVRGTRHDICPGCGGQREELLIAADLFYCPSCAKSTFGPNTERPAPRTEQTGLFSVSELGQPAEAIFEDEAPIDEGMAWVADEAPDE